MEKLTKKLVLATSNKNKVKEISNLLQSTSIETIPVEGNFDPEENGSTFEENAFIKAFEAAKIMNMPALADDSGLVVDAIEGNPGIYSSRYAETDEKRIERVLDELSSSNNSDRSARFVCAMCIVTPEGKILHSCIGKCEGVIINKKTGNNGFGYDPIFLIPELNKTLAQLTLEEKNKISHRSNALKCMIEWIKENL